MSTVGVDDFFGEIFSTSPERQYSLPPTSQSLGQSILTNINLVLQPTLAPTEFTLRILIPVNLLWLNGEATGGILTILAG